MMAARDDDEIFVYMGGEQRVPYGVRRARIHKDVKIVREYAFQNRRHLISVEIHDGVEIIEKNAFYQCPLRSVKLLGVKIIKHSAFFGCESLTDVEFGDKLEKIKEQAFQYCRALNKISMPSVRTVWMYAFANCSKLSDVECGEALRTLSGYAFASCPKLERIALPLKGGMIENHVFIGCSKLETVDLVGGIHNIVASLHMESWRNEMTGEINRINQVLPTLRESRTEEMREWMRAVINPFDHYK